jgi:hypothetical protein
MKNNMSNADLIVLKRMASRRERRFGCTLPDVPSPTSTTCNSCYQCHLCHLTKKTGVYLDGLCSTVIVCHVEIDNHIQLAITVTKAGRTNGCRSIALQRRRLASYNP